MHDRFHSAEPLPIAAIVPDVVASLRSNRNVVVRAPPGAGKTTQIPLAWLGATDRDDGEMVVIEPRRLAARSPAHHIARMLHESIGEQCGYQVRFDARVGPRTRIRFVTEGVFLRQILAGPSLPKVSVVVLDEFHERRLDADVALAMVRRLQKGPRPDLRIMVMSATIETKPLADFLDADVHESEGRLFPVTVEHAKIPDDRPLERQISATLRRLIDEDEAGDVLIFLPGRGEIERARLQCASMCAKAGIDVVELHGELSPEAQDAATHRGARRKIILATNVAETSITVEGVTTIIDSGWARRAGHDPWTGLSTLDLRPISRASAVQRAGRAGRLGPGRCLRLFTRADFERRPAQEVPEIERSDLTSAVLTMLGAGIDIISDPPWLIAPPPSALEGAFQLLTDLGAVEHGRLTSLGQSMLSFPVHPRHARVLCEARRRGVTRSAAGVVAVLEERPLRFPRPQATASAADPLAQWERIDQARRRPKTTGEPEVLGAWRQIARVEKMLRTMIGDDRAPPDDPDEGVCASLLAGYPDRIARVRVESSGNRTLVMAGGGHALLSETSEVAQSNFVVALRAHQLRGSSRGTRTVVDSAAAVSPEMLLDLFPDRLEEHTEVRFDASLERVVAISELRYRGLVIESTELSRPPAEAGEILFAAALEHGPTAYVTDPATLHRFLERVRFVADHGSVALPVSVDELIQAVLRPLCAQATSFAELRRMDVLSHLEATLPSDFKTSLKRLAPPMVTLPSGRRLTVHYDPDRDPWIESRLQDFFGMTRGPALGDGRVPLVLHLLAPNGRAVQVTRDLAGFWRAHYPDLKRSLSRRYPKHPWPDDPLTAAPPQVGPRGSSRRRR